MGLAEVLHCRPGVVAATAQGDVLNLMAVAAGEWLLVMVLQPHSRAAAVAIGGLKGAAAAVTQVDRAANGVGNTAGGGGCHDRGIDDLPGQRLGPFTDRGVNDLPGQRLGPYPDRGSNDLPG